MSGDSIIPTVLPPSPPSGGGGEPANDRYGSGGYFSGDNQMGRGGPGNDPLPYFRILHREGEFYWYVNFRYNTHWGEYSVCVYHTKENADWNTLTEEEKNAVYERAELVWEITNDTTKEKRYSEHLKLIEEKYRNGYFFARAKRKEKLGKPTVCQPFPAVGKFVIPAKVKNFQIEESPYYVNNYTNPISCVNITYSPPDNMAGFWGVKVYVQGYQGDNEIRELAIRKYDKRQGEADSFDILLEPSVDVQLENYVIGSDDNTNYDSIMYPVKRALKVSPVTAGGVNTDAIEIEMYKFVSSPSRQWSAGDPSTSDYYFDNKTGRGDTIILSAEGSGANSYLIEAIIEKYDETYPHRKIYCKLKNMPSSYEPPTYQLGTISPYLTWKVVKSCKFYLISINEYGYHGDLEHDALTEYCALDGLESAPVPPLNINAFQCENQNIISFIYPSTSLNYDDIEEFNIYRCIVGGDGKWNKLVSIKAKSKSNDVYGTYTGTSEPYKYVDGDMANLDFDDQTWNYAVGVKYGVSVVDKVGMESVIGVATHYLIDGTESDYIPFRRGTGIDHSPIVVVRGGVFNLFYNSQASWDNYGTTGSNQYNGAGNSHLYNWAIWGRETSTQVITITYNQPSASITIPTKHVWKAIRVYVETGFNGTNRTIDVGIQTNTAYYINDLNVSTTGWKTITYVNSPPLLYTGSNTYIVTFNGYGAGATAGKAYVYIDYYDNAGLAHPEASLNWKATSFTFEITFSSILMRNRWIKMLTQSNSTPVPSSTTLNYDFVTYPALGRAKICIPGIQYICHINYMSASNSDAKLIISPDITQFPPYTADTTITANEYFISIVPFEWTSTTDPYINTYAIDNMSYTSLIPAFINGWIYMHSGNQLPLFENGVFNFMAPSQRIYQILTNTTTTFSFTINGAHTLVDIGIYVETGFDGTNPTIDVGTTSNYEYYINDLNVSTRGWKYFSYVNQPGSSASSVTYTGRFNGTGATKGKVYVYFYYYTSSTSGKCLWEQRIRKEALYPDQDITLSFFIARDSLVSRLGSGYGTLSYYIKPETKMIVNYNFTMPNSTSDYKSTIPLSECLNRGLDGKLQYSYMVMYGKVPTNYNWDDVKYVRIGLIAEWGSNDFKCNYVMTKPMLNYGNEAAPYTERNDTEKIAMLPPLTYVPGQNPPSHDEDDPMCIAAGQYITMWNGEKRLVEELKINDMVRSLGTTSIIKSLEIAENRDTIVFIMDGNYRLECTPEHLCLTDTFMPKAAKDIKIGDYMLTIDNKKISVLNILKKKNKVFKITTSLPHIIIINGIWTHNAKAGGGEY